MKYQTAHHINLCKPVILAILVFLSLGLNAQENAEQASENVEKTAAQLAIDAIVKDTARWDWVRLTSGEWLKGEFISLYEREIEFDSDELDTIYLDDDDVDIIISEKTHSILFRDGTILYGTILMYDNKLLIGNDDRGLLYTDVVSIGGSQESRGNLWKIKISLGGNFRSGNINENEWTLTTNIKRRTASSRFTADVIAYRTRNEDLITKESQRLTVNYDYFYTAKLFFRPAILEYYSDRFLNIKHKVTYGAGVGYYFVDTKKTEWDVNIGPSFQYTEFETVEVNEDNQAESFAGYIDTSFEQEITEDIDFTFSYSFIGASEDAGGNSHHTVASFSFDITDDIDFDISAVWDRLDSPQPNENGIVPEKDDYLVYFTFGVDF